MEQPTHDLAALFKQLGLDHTDMSIDQFIERHKGLNPELALHQATFWNPSQAAFLTQVREEDADWVEIVDHLDAMLR